MKRNAGATGGPPGVGHRVVGRYRLRELVGAGDMGLVWRATDDVLDRTVAVKQLSGIGRDAGCELVEEARIAARLDHPRLLRVLDLVVEDGVPWLVLQHVGARSWGSQWQERGPVAPRAAAQVGAQVAEALTALHAGGIVHGDVTPDNVLVDGDGEVKLVDFGAARLLASSETGMARDGTTGMRDYRAPETRRGASVGAAADLYALGRTLLDALGASPPGPLASVLAGLLAEDPAGRPSASEARAWLESVAFGGDQRLGRSGPV